MDQRISETIVFNFENKNHCRQATLLIWLITMTITCLYHNRMHPKKPLVFQWLLQYALIKPHLICVIQINFAITITAGVQKRFDMLKIHYSASSPDWI